MFSLMPWRKERNEVEMRPNRDPLSLFRNEFDALFDRFLGNFPSTWRNMPEMAGAQLEETETEIVCRMDAPGFEAKDFNLELNADHLKIDAEHKEDKGDGKEVSTRRVQQYLWLPKEVDPEKVEATYRNGVLEIHLTKSPEAQGKKIEVKA